MDLMSILESTTNLRRQTNIDKYLYEIVEDYKDSESDEEKNEMLNLFCSSIWSCNNKRRVYTKAIKFNVQKSLLNDEIGKIFDMWSKIEYKGYKSMSEETDWCSLIRQKVNNLYTRYFDEDVILRKDYMNLLKTPKNLYYRWIDGQEMDSDELTTIITDAIDNAEKLKSTYQKQKMDLSWDEYKSVIEGFFIKIFNNARKIEEYEDETKIVNMYDFINEDNFYIKYFCKYLENEMKQYQKKYYGLYNPCKRVKENGYKIKRCECCGKLIKKNGNKKKYCNECGNQKERERKRKIAYKYRVAK